MWKYWYNYYKKFKWITLLWKKLSHKDSFYFRIYADFEADNETDTSNIGNRTTIFYKQNPVLSGSNIISDLDDVSERSFWKFPLDYNNVDWFVNEVMKIRKYYGFLF